MNSPSILSGCRILDLKQLTLNMPVMMLIYQATLFLHVVGFGLLLGGLFGQLGKHAEVTSTMVIGAIMAFISGVLLVAFAETVPGAPASKPWLIGVKATVGIALVGLVVANRRWKSIPRGVWLILVLLALTQAALGVFGH